MANREIIPSTPSSHESGSGDNKNDGKTSRPIRVPLGKLAGEQQPEQKSAESKRIIDILAERQVQQQLEANQQLNFEDKSDKKKKRTSKDKAKASETAKDVDNKTEQPEPSPALSIFETTEPAAEPVVSEVESDAEIETETAESAETLEDKLAEHELPLAEGAVELPLEGGTEIALSERRVQAWNRARQQSPPTAPMSEVGQPGPIEPAEALSAEQPEIVAEQLATAEQVTTDNTTEPLMPAVEAWRDQPEQQQQVSPASSPIRPHAMPVAPPPDVPSQTPPKIPPMPPYPGHGMPPPPEHLPASQPDMMPSGVPAMQPEARPIEVQRGGSGFWPGVAVGAGVEHIRHKRREKRMEKDQDAQQERITELESTAQRERLQQDITENERMRAEADARYREAAMPAEAPVLPSTPVRAEQSPLIPIAVEQSRLHTQPLRPEAPASIAPVAPEAEQPDAEAEAANNPPERRHIETSSWHAIEVDDRTGHVVEDSRIAYGEAFAQEQRAERQPQSTQQAGQEERTTQNTSAQSSASGVPTLPQPWQATPPPPPADPRMMGAPDQLSPEQRQAQRVRNSRPPLVQSSADAALWVGLMIVVIAVVVALSL